MSLPKPYYEDDFVTLYHGDCLELLPFVSADVLVTDPPYGYSFQSGWAGKYQGKQIANDSDTSARDAVLTAWGERPVVMFGSWKRPRPSTSRAVLIWDKGDDPRMGDLKFPWGPSFEEIYVIGDGFSGKRGPSVLRAAPPPKMSSHRDHPNEKPVHLMADLLAKCPAGTILDPFAGSGTTLRAAKDLGRKSIGIEIEEKYCEIAANRCAQEVMDFGKEAA